MEVFAGLGGLAVVGAAGPLREALPFNPLPVHRCEEMVSLAQS